MLYSFQRHQRVESLLKEELNKIILKEMEFPDTLVTITEVKIQKDLDYATINISVLPNEKSDKVLKNLEKSRGYLQHLLLKKINIKPMPEIRFNLDIGFKKAAEVEKALLEIEKEKR